MKKKNVMEELVQEIGGLLSYAQEMAKNPGRHICETALAYALTGEKAYADRARHQLVHQARHMMPAYEKLDLTVGEEVVVTVPPEAVHLIPFGSRQAGPAAGPV